MRLHRFFINEQIGHNSYIEVKNTELSNQLRRVFRLKRGDSVVLFDNSGFEYTANIKDIRDDMIFFQILKYSDKTLDICNITLFASIIKKDKFEWIVEKATELGISSIYPVVSDRSEKKNLNMERLNKIAIESAEQSGRVFVPKVFDIIDFDEAITIVKNKNLKSTALHTNAKTPLLTHKRFFDALFIGPEGGFTEGEIEKFSLNNIPMFNLGSNILKSETATIVAISKLV